MHEICQKRLRFAPWLEEKSRRLPGVMPLEMADWLQVDEAFDAQIAEKARLLRACREEVLQTSPQAQASAEELLALATKHSEAVPHGSDEPLAKLATFTQEDFCILQKQGDEHVLTAALLCFPASWTLAEKFLRPLTVIHDPVAPYTDDIAKRVQRLFDAVRPDRPLWRANALRYSDPTLFQPRRYGENRDHPEEGGYIRSERQSILRLPETDAVVFSIHTTVIPESALTPEQAAGLQKHPIIHASEDA